MLNNGKSRELIQSSINDLLWKHCMENNLDPAIIDNVIGKFRVAFDFDNLNNFDVKFDLHYDLENRLRNLIKTLIKQ